MAGEFLSKAEFEELLEISADKTRSADLRMKLLLTIRSFLAYDDDETRTTVLRNESRVTDSRTDATRESIVGQYPAGENLGIDVKFLRERVTATASNGAVAEVLLR